MKTLRMKNLLFFSAVALILTVSCNKENAVTNPEAVTVQFIANVDNISSKTVMTQDGNIYKSNWNGQEWIQIVGQNGYYWFNTDNNASGTSATFSYNGNNGEYNETGAVMAVYPAGSSNYTDRNFETRSINGITIPEHQIYVEGSYDPNAALAFAYTENDVLNFKNLTSLIKFEIGNDHVNEIYLYSTNSKPLAGSLKATYTDDDKVDIAVGTADQKTTITLYNHHKNFGKGQTYYIAVMPNVDIDGFTLEYKIDGIAYKKTTEKTLSTKRNGIYDLGIITQDNVIETAYKRLYLKPGTHWDFDSAVFKVYAHTPDVSKKPAGAADYAWYNLTLYDGTAGIYSCDVPDYFTKVGFIRWNPAYAQAVWDVDEGAKVWANFANFDIVNYDYLMLTSYSEGNWLNYLENGQAYPHNGTAVVLDSDKENEIACTFAWASSTEFAEGSEIMFSASEDMASPVKFDAGTGSSVSLTHNQLQTLVGGLSLKPYSESTVYWNICDKTTQTNIFSEARNIKLTGMMIFDDVRGTETIRYGVSRITLLDGTTQIWLSQNLRATKYPDGTDIQVDHNVFEPGYIGEIDDTLYKLFGGYYHTSIKNDIVPEGWRLPSKADFVNLVKAAKNANAAGEGNAAVLLYDYADFWKELDTGNAFLTDAEKNHINEWNMNFVPAGMIGNDSQMGSAMTRYCYFQCSDEAVLFWGFDANGDWDGEWETKCSVRLVYNETN